MIRTLTIATMAIATSACMHSGAAADDTSSGAATVSVTGAPLSASDGAARGMAQFREENGGLMVHVEAQGLAPGTHGIHVHTTGRCDPPDFASAGPHWNPTGKQHGRDNPQGAHHGDLPNISIGADGRGTLHFTVPGASFAELLDADGAALVIHANADDDRTDPSGNSGGRVACGVIRRGG